jgi:hypothetical protein
MRAGRWRLLLPALWAGLLLAIALIGAPAAFAALAPADAGRVVGRLFAQEAYLSLAFGVALLLLERRVARDDAAAGHGSVFSTNLVLLLGTLFCTVAGYFAVEPMMAAARAGQGSVSFAVLHGVSAGFYALKTLLVLAFSWRVTRPIS